MRIKFEYPMATEENMKAIQKAINAGMGAAELLDSFLEEMVWDCVVVLSGNKDTPWALLNHMDGNHQTGIEDWQYEIIEDFIQEKPDEAAEDEMKEKNYYKGGVMTIE